MSDLLLEVASEIAFSEKDWTELNGKFLTEQEVVKEGYVFHIQVAPKDMWEDSPVQEVHGTGTSYQKPNARGVIHQIGTYWLHTHQRIMGYSYGNILTRKDYALIKTLLREYNPDFVEKMILHFIGHYNSIPNYSGAPTVPGLVGYRKQVAMQLNHSETQRTPDGGASI